MKIDAIARTIDTPCGEVLIILEIYKMIKRTDTELKVTDFKVTDLGQFFCDKALDDVFEVEWHADKLFKLNEFKEWLDVAAN